MLSGRGAPFLSSRPIVFLHILDYSMFWIDFSVTLRVRTFPGSLAPAVLRKRSVGDRGSGRSLPLTPPTLTDSPPETARGPERLHLSPIFW